MHRQAQRLASAGYLVVMPDLFTDGGAVRCLVPTFRAALSGQGRAFRDIEAARTRLAQDPDCTGRIGIIGFCMGGAFALLAVSDGEFDAASVNYGRPPKDLDAALDGSCPVVASYGARDRTLRGAAPEWRRRSTGSASSTTSRNTRRPGTPSSTTPRSGHARCVR